jgi:hypothetical protein
VKPFFAHPGDPVDPDPIANLIFLMPGLVPGSHILFSVTPDRIDSRDKSRP